MGEPTFVDLFCGGGGAGTGLLQAGYRHLLGLDFDQQACATYRENVGECWQGDISAVRWQDITGAVGRPSHLHFSPPCPDFSPAGHGDGWDGEGGMLMWQPVRLLQEAAEAGTMPATISMENSSALLQKRHAQGFGRWLQAITELGYRLAYGALDAADYGAPQHRKRVIMLGALHFTPALPRRTHWPRKAAAQGASWEETRCLWASAREALAGHITPAETEFGARRTRTVNGEKRVVTERTSMEQPSLAIRTASGGSSHLFICAGERERRATVQEVALLQTFPPGYRFTGAVRDQYKQIGNAVPPLLARCIGEVVLALHGIEQRPVIAV